MIIKTYSETIRNAHIIISEGDKIFDTTFINCMIDYSGAKGVWAESCVFDESCVFIDGLKSSTNKPKG